MKRTITVDLGRMLFHIDEEAYQRLEGYLRSWEEHFAGDPAAEEILEDIEGRMAELFRERLKDREQVLTLPLVERVIGIMGDPGEMEEEDPARPVHTEKKRSYRRIYRDPDNRIVGGVCGGLGAYFRIDPILFRILFILLTVAGGSGILLYLILWIIIPEARTTAQKLEMRGEPVNASSIGRKVKEESGKSPNA